MQTTAPLHVHGRPARRLQHRHSEGVHWQGDDARSLGLLIVLRIQLQGEVEKGGGGVGKQEAVHVTGSTKSQWPWDAQGQRASCQKCDISRQRCARLHKTPRACMCVGVQVLYLGGILRHAQVLVHVLQLLGVLGTTHGLHALDAWVGQGTMQGRRQHCRHGNDAGQTETSQIQKLASSSTHRTLEQCLE